MYDPPYDQIFVLLNNKTTTFTFNKVTMIEYEVLKWRKRDDLFSGWWDNLMRWDIVKGVTTTSSFHLGVLFLYWPVSFHWVMENTIMVAMAMGLSTQSQGILSYLFRYTLYPSYVAATYISFLHQIRKEIR